jgi:DNA repair exonuclease SbcCD ATPase subunit
MINYKKLSWGYCFSYGDNNSIELDQNSITQLVGKNGHGKSSIALILEEVLFNKNSKGVKKQHILNRNGGSKSYWIKLEFEKDGDSYEISTTRGSTQHVSLTRNGTDISAHTATQTFKDIEVLIGYDHKTFSQIVYQSSAASLEFLTATDSNRKKFLIDLLNLSKYNKALDVIKTAAQSVNKDVTLWEGKLSSVQSWLAKYSKSNLEKIELMEVKEVDVGLYTTRLELMTSLKNVDSESATISQNLTYKKLLDAVVLYPIPSVNFDLKKKQNLEERISLCNAELTLNKNQLASLKNTKDKCPTCGQSLGVDRAHIDAEVTKILASTADKKQELEVLELERTQLTKLQSEHRAAMEAQDTWEKYHRLYDPKLPQVLPDAASIRKQLDAINLEISKQEAAFKSTEAFNTKAIVHNAGVDNTLKQIAEFEAERAFCTTKLEELIKISSNYAVLVKAFSTTGLVAYKIECLVKDLENLTNEYLTEMADGRFQLKFEISQADKLNVVITDNGEDIDIAALSTGERARVNVATLLAIRKLMQSLSNTKTNLLILDETVESLDAEGKERIIEVLLNEPGLNTVLVSHSFTHPLIDRVNIVKEDGISRIDYGS